jgi:hypothetical protein
MGTNNLYTMVTSDEEGGGVPKLQPSDYFSSLPPQEAVAELNARRKSLEDRLGEFAKVDLEVPENLDRAREVSLELEVIQDFLRDFQKTHGI